MPFDMWWFYFITEQGLVCHFLPFLPLSCLKINGCTNFILLLTFLRPWWRNLSGGKKSHMNELTWNRKTNKWLIILYDQECCQNNLLAISASWWRKTAFSLKLHSVNRKGHQVPLMRKMKNASDFLRSSSTMKQYFLFFRSLAAVMLCRQASSPCAIFKGKLFAK